MKNRTKIYFASDFHLGNYSNNKHRENKIISWLQTIEKDAKELYLVGDIFDFWFEHKYSIPKGNIRFLGMLASLKDKGVEIHLFTGNHDMWMFGYLEKEIGLNVIKNPITKKIENKIFFIGHGDGLGPGDRKYKFVKKIFTNSLCQWLFARLHPNLSFSIAHYWSKMSRENENSESPSFLGEDKEWLIQYSKEKLKENEDIEYFIFGHRHVPIHHKIGDKSTYINLGDWINHYTYGVFDGEKVELKKFK